MLTKTPQFNDLDTRVVIRRFRCFSFALLSTHCHISSIPPEMAADKRRLETPQLLNEEEPAERGTDKKRQQRASSADSTASDVRRIRSLLL